jgi:large subunit ribosomal protein L30
MARLRITQIRSEITQSRSHLGTMRALGLRRIGRSVEHEESPQLAGALKKVSHLVKVEEV